jgi:transposase
VSDVPERVEAIRSSAAAWAAFWDGHLDLDALAFDVTQHLTDMSDAKARTERATAFASAKAAASYVGLNPSTWSSGTVSQPSRAITKEGPAALRLAFFQAANAARRQIRNWPGSTTG